MAKLKAGVIGLGMGWGHLQGYLAHPDVEVVAIAERREARRQKAADLNAGLKIYNEGIDMIRNEKLDILSVAVPNNQHMELTIAGLEAGANVLCEKPMAMNTCEAEKMLETAKRVNRKLGIDFSYRFNPAARAMKSMVEAGEMGEIYYARSVWLRRRGIPGLSNANFNTAGSQGCWFFDKKQSGGGPLIDLGVHRLDLALWLMGYPEPAWVIGSTYDKLAKKMAAKRGVEYTVEDFACAMIKFKNGATLELDASWASNIEEQEQMYTRIIGDEGGLLHFNLNETYEFDVKAFKEVDGRQYDWRLHKPFPPTPSAFTLFADSVRDNTPFLVQPEEGVTVMKLLDAIYESSATGKPVEFK